MYNWQRQVRSIMKHRRSEDQNRKDYSITDRNRENQKASEESPLQTICYKDKMWQKCCIK